MPPLPIAIIADDLTGAADTAAAFARPDRPVPVSLDERPSLSEDCSAFAVTTESRACPADAAHDLLIAAARAVLATGPGLIYKKVDSNLRGNIGAEVGAIHEVTGRPIVLAPAFPARGRTILRGLVLINGIPAAETEMAQDPEAPLRHSDVAGLIHAQRPHLSVAHLSLQDLRAPTLDLAGRLRESAILIADAETDADLDTIAEAALSIDPAPILAGSAGFARAVARRLLGTPAPPPCLCGELNMATPMPNMPSPMPSAPDAGTPTVPRVPSPVPGVPRVPPSVQDVPTSSPPASKSGQENVLAVLASSSRRLMDQIAVARQEQGLALIPLPCERLSWDEETVPELAQAIAGASAQLAAGRDALVYAVGALPQTERPVDLIVEHLAHLAFVVIKSASPGSLLVGGGATAHAVLSCLGARAIQIDEEPLPGIAAGVAIGGHFAGRPLVLKPGAAGDEAALVRLIRYLRRRGASREQI